MAASASARSTPARLRWLRFRSAGIARVRFASNWRFFAIALRSPLHAAAPRFSLAALVVSSTSASPDSRVLSCPRGEASFTHPAAARTAPRALLTAALLCLRTSSPSAAHVVAQTQQARARSAAPRPRFLPLRLDHVGRLCVGARSSVWGRQLSIRMVLQNRGLLNLTSSSELTSLLGMNLFLAGRPPASPQSLLVVPPVCAVAGPPRGTLSLLRVSVLCFALDGWGLSLCGDGTRAPSLVERSLADPWAARRCALRFSGAEMHSKNFCELIHR